MRFTWCLDFAYNDDNNNGAFFCLLRAFLEELPLGITYCECANNYHFTWPRHGDCLAQAAKRRHGRVIRLSAPWLKYSLAFETAQFVDQTAADPVQRSLLDCCRFYRFSRGKAVAAESPTTWSLSCSLLSSVWLVGQRLVRTSTDQPMTNARFQKDNLMEWSLTATQSSHTMGQYAHAQLCTYWGNQLSESSTGKYVG